MTTIRYARAALEDLERIVAFLSEYTEQDAQRRVKTIVSAIEVLLLSPEVGRPTAGACHELILGRGAAGFVALYRFDPEDDDVVVLRIRAQREDGSPD
ncbi:MAG: type II toxin-antitoxin system RelE/ParE family toxin [Archangium sp.]